MNRTFFVSLCFVVTLSSICGNIYGQNSRINLSQLWKTDVKTFLENSPVLVHLTGSDESQVVVAGREDLIALDSNGKEIWRYRSPGRYMMSPSVLELKGNSPFIFATDNLGNLRCHDYQGKIVWETKLSAACTWSAPALGDLNGDGNYSVIQGDESGTIHAFDALSGKPQWKSSIKGKPSGAAMGDLDGKKGLEVAYLSTEGILSVLHSDGSPFWERTIGGTCQTWGNAAPVIFGSSEGKTKIFVASGNGEAFCYSSTGKLLWNKSVRGAVASTLSVGDIDQDGIADLFLITQLGVIYRFSENGDLLWNIDMQGRTLGSGSIADLNGDGRLEYMYCTQDGHLQVLDFQGTTVFDYNFGHRTINETPTFGEVSKKTSGLEMVITGGESGLVYCFKTTAPVNGKKQWITYGGSDTRCNYWNSLTSKSQLSIVPANLNWNELYLGEDVCFEIFNPEATTGMISVEASCIHPDGKFQSVTSKLVGHHSKIYLPFTGMAPGKYDFKWKLSLPDGKMILSGDKSISLNPFLNEKSLIRAVSSRLSKLGNKISTQNNELAEALINEAECLERQFRFLHPLQESALAGGYPDNGEIIQKSNELTKRAKKDFKIAELTEESLSLKPNTTLLPFEGALWENRERDEAVPEVAANNIVLSRTMVAGENEPFSVNLFNLAGRSITARIQADSIPEGLKITFHHSVPTVDALGKPSWDALPEIDESKTISVPSFSTAELWINLSGSEGLKPGHYKIPVIIQSLNGFHVQNGPKSPQDVDLQVSMVEIDLEVLNFKMAPEGAFRLCAWGAYDKPSIRNLLDHGNNVFVVPQGKSTGDQSMIDFSEQDKVINELAGHDVFVLLSGLPDMVKDSELGNAALSTESVSTLNNYLERLTAHLASKGIDKKHFAFYPYDEPGGIGWTIVNKLVAFSKLVKQKDPELLVYMDGGGEAPMFSAMQPYIDVWCVGYNALPEVSPVMDIVRKDPGGILWSYDCSYSFARPMGPNIKNINIIGQFRISALAAFRWDAAGIGYWSYNLGGNMWGRTMFEYPLVYKGTGKPVNSRRWEAVREGIEDYRIVTNLKKLITQNPASISADAKNRIDKLLKSLTEFIDQSDGEMKLGLSRKVLDVTNSEEAIIRLRSEMMECIKQVSK